MKRNANIQVGTCLPHLGIDELEVHDNSFSFALAATISADHVRGADLPCSRRGDAT